MKEKIIRNWSILILLSVYVILYRLFIFQNTILYSKFITASFLAAILSLCIVLLGFKKFESTEISKKIFKTVLFHILITFIIMYGVGLVTGFSKNFSSFMGLFNGIFAPILIIVFVEFIRYIFIIANRKNKLLVILLTIILTILELVTTVSYFDISDLVVTFTITTKLILPCIFKNLLLSYLAYHVGYKTPIVYRLIMDLYLVIIPVLPKLGDYVSSMIFISLPILIYINTFGNFDDNNIVYEKENDKKKFTIVDIIVSIILIVLISLMSGIFPYYMIGIGSNSMYPVISKGDAIILKKVDKNTELKKGDIIAYSNGKITIVHRINEVVESGYITKGDANNGPDLRAVERNKVKGVVKLKIPYIAWPTVWLTELFKR